MHLPIVVIFNIGGDIDLDKGAAGIAHLHFPRRPKLTSLADLGFDLDRVLEFLLLVFKLVRELEPPLGLLNLAAVPQGLCLAHKAVDLFVKNFYLHLDLFLRFRTDPVRRQRFPLPLLELLLGPLDPGVAVAKQPLDVLEEVLLPPLLLPAVLCHLEGLLEVVVVDVLAGAQIHFGIDKQVMGAVLHLGEENLELFMQTHN